MLVPPLLLETKDFVVEHLDDSPENLQLIAAFTSSNNAMGLELYLKYQAINDEDNGQSRTYLVKDALTRELACYFSLRTCLIPYQLADRRINLSAIELANFAVGCSFVVTASVIYDFKKNKKAARGCLFVVPAGHDPATH